MIKKPSFLKTLATRLARHSASQPEKAPPVCDFNCKACFKQAFEEYQRIKALSKHMTVGCCLSCKHSTDREYRSSKEIRGVSSNINDIIKAYGSLQKYHEVMNSPADVVSLRCNLDYEKASEAAKENPPRTLAVPRLEFYTMHPCYRNGEPCHYWREGFLRNMITGELLPC